MLIKTRIAAGGGRSLTRIPLPRASLAECLTAPDPRTGRQRVDRAKALGALHDSELSSFTHSSKDDETIYYVALTFIDNLHAAYERVVEDREADCSSEAQSKQDEIVERKAERDKVVFARISITHCSDEDGQGVRVGFRVDNPYNTVGDAEVEAENYLVAAIQIFQRIQRCFGWIRIEADPELIGRAERNNADADLRAEWRDCGRKVNGYCSPMNPACPFCKAGKCLYGRKEERV